MSTTLRNRQTCLYTNTETRLSVPYEKEAALKVAILTQNCKELQDRFHIMEGISIKIGKRYEKLIGVVVLLLCQR